MINTISVIGAGSWGTALAVLLAKKGLNVRLWVYKKETFDMIHQEGENSQYLPGVKFPSNIQVFLEQKEAVQGGELILLSVTSQAIRPTARNIASNIPDGQIIVNSAKGLETKTLKRMSQVIQEEIPQSRIVVLSGPSHAEEVGRGLPTTVVSASEHIDAAKMVQDVFMNYHFRVYTNSDLIGVETGGALKNIIALAAGISDGLGFGDNTKAALMTRGIAEIARLGKAMGASALTFAGLAGVGDLIVTCTSMHSRNRRAGILIGQGKSLDKALKEIGMVVEGVKTCQAAYKLSKTLQVEMPITEQLFHVLFKGKDAKLAVEDLMLRSRTHESEQILNDMHLKYL